MAPHAPPPTGRVKSPTSPLSATTSSFPISEDTGACRTLRTSPMSSRLDTTDPALLKPSVLSEEPRLCRRWFTTSSTASVRSCGSRPRISRATRMRFDLERMCATLKKASGSEHCRYWKLLTAPRAGARLVEEKEYKRIRSVLLEGGMTSPVTCYQVAANNGNMAGHKAFFPTALLEEQWHVKKPVLFSAATLGHVSRHAPN
ncbi:uncharacterized protein BXZ73DRAFT_81690 [Epithele typhae]|uniref:uncharacterized protein n=1 Tax=Epithele typhae TaxID=378194 RepID=UPI002007CD97|nr:uncharacterized protein BXZ73DRAFT_81690 [Epithele typhae]KAH9914395.1 hypothetical protein BXZ73DRAFT_81690 [Epithele typhae]